MKKNRIYLAHSNNWSAVQSELNGYSSTDLTNFASKVHNGSFLYLPRHKNNAAAGWDWEGSGYVELREDELGISVGMIIIGDFITSGGWSVNASTINAAPLTHSSYSQPNYYNYGGASSITLAPTPTYNTPSFVGSDPVDMRTGAFVYDHTALELGGAGPRGVHFARHYSSARRQTDRPGLGYGWTHNYDMRASIRTAPEAGLGETTTYEAASMLAAAAMINELVGVVTNVKDQVAAALMAKYAVDNLLNNAISVTVGKETVQFIRQPNGDYTAPAASTMSMERDGNEIRMSERLGNTWTFDLSAGGRLTSTEDFFGNTQLFAYDGSGQLETITDADGRKLTFTWIGGRITGVTDSTGRSVSFGYNANGDLIEATDPENKTTQYSYDGEHRIVEILDPEKRTIIANEYDSESRVAFQQSEGDTNKQWQLSFSGLLNIEADPLGGRTLYAYDKRARPLYAEDAEGNRTVMRYNGHDHMTLQQSPGGREIRSIFDPDHNLRVQSDGPVGLVTNIIVNANYEITAIERDASIEPNGTVTVYAYDGLHRPTSTTVQDLSGIVADRTTLLEYDVGNDSRNPNKTVDPRGNETLYTYYADGLLHTETRVSTNGNRTVTWEYDTRGMPQKAIYPDATFDLFVYSERGDLVSRTDRNGNTTTNIYNSRRQLVQAVAPDGGTTVYIYDDSGNLNTVTDPKGNVTRHTWTPQGKPVSVTTAYGTPAVTTFTHEYDVRDWRVRTIDPLARVAQFEYDNAQRLIKTTDPLERETRLAYDADGNLIEQVSPMGFTNRFAYNVRGERITMTDPLGDTVVYARNSFGEQIALTNRRDYAFVFTYDQGGNPLTLTTPLGHTAVTVWDDLNQIERSIRPSGITNHLVYNAAGRIQSQTDPLGTISFVYDNNGNPVTVTEGAHILARTFDNMNRVLTYTDASGNTIGYHWDKNGNLTNIVYPDSRSVAYAYDAHNRLKTVTDWTNRVTTYHWDAAGRLTGIDRPNGVNRINQYTAADELDRYYERRSSDSILLAYGRFRYDAAGRPTSRYRLPQPQEWVEPAFDAVYDADNRISQWDAQSVTHDNDGNMTFGPLPESGLTNYVFDARNRLTAVGGVSYSYDASNNRIGMTTPNGTTRYVIDPHGDALPRVLVRKQPDESLTYYVYGIGLLYETDESDTATYYHFDHIGSTVALTDEAGEITDRIEYSAYGSVTHREGTTDTPFLYVGQLGIQQDDNGLLYMRARYYSPEARRFVNADPIGFDGGMNWYSYANNNPLLYVDPHGLWAVLDDAIAIAGGAMIGVIGQGVSDLITSYRSESLQSSGWEAYVSSAVGGATMGEVLLYTANPIVAGAAGGLARSGTKQGIQSFTQDKPFSWGEVAVETTVGAATGLIPGQRIPGITSGRGSYVAVANQMTTKFKNDQIKNITASTGAKMVTGRSVQGAAFEGAVVGGVIQGLLTPTPFERNGYASGSHSTFVYSVFKVMSWLNGVTALGP